MFMSHSFVLLQKLGPVKDPLYSYYFSTRSWRERVAVISWGISPKSIHPINHGLKNSRLDASCGLPKMRVKNEGFTLISIVPDRASLLFPRYPSAHCSLQPSVRGPRSGLVPGGTTPSSHSWFPWCAPTFWPHG